MLPFKKEFKITAGYDWHKQHENGFALDFNCPTGTELIAVTSGFVERFSTWWGGTDTIILHGDNGVNYLYAHCLSTKKTGKVKVGEVIALSGYDGNCVPKGPAGAHLHIAADADYQRLKGYSVNLTTTKQLDDVFSWDNKYKVVIKDTPYKDKTILKVGTVVEYVRHGDVYVKLLVNGQTKYVHKNWYHNGRFK